MQKTLLTILNYNGNVCKIITKKMESKLFNWNDIVMFGRLEKDTNHYNIYECITLATANNKQGYQSKFRVYIHEISEVPDLVLKKLWHHRTSKKNSKANDMFTEPILKTELEKLGYELFEKKWLKNDQVRTIKHLRKLSNPEGIIHYGQKSFTIDQFINQIKGNTPVGKEYVKGLLRAEEFLNS